MITKIVSLISSFFVATTMIFSSGGNPSLANSLAQVQPAVYQQAPTPPANPLPASPSDATASQGLAGRIRELLGKRAFQGDRQVRQGLVLAAVSVTGQTPVEILQALQNGQSIAEIAQSAGKTSADVLNIYHQTVEYLFEEAIQKHPALANSQELRQSWYEQAGALEVDLPGMKPEFPSLPELRAAATLATMDVSGVDRAQLRQDLRADSSLNDILVKSGHTSQEAVTAAMNRIDTRLNTLVDNGKLNAAQRRAWSTSISDLLTQIINASTGKPTNSVPASSDPGI
jgi:hypothetical protein